jgi:hypothetical protein
MKWVNLENLPENLTPEVAAAFKHLKGGGFYSEI